MRKATVFYIVTVIAFAGLAFAVLYRVAPTLPEGSAVAVALLAVLAILAEVLSFLLPRAAARGSIAIVPYLAMAILVPNWLAILAVVTVKAIMGAANRIVVHKAVFNVGQMAFSLSVAILTFRALGGVSLLEIRPASLLNVTRVSGGQALAAFAISYLLNSLLVCGVIALEAKGSIWAIWHEIKIATFGLDLLISPPIFVFAWVYAAYGSIAAATLWVPFLGIRQSHRTNLELEQTNQELLELMVKSLEARDPYTSGHSRRVREFSRIIARAIGLSPREIEHVSRAALLHDVGKIHEKYAPILSKAEKLSPDEWALMKEHPGDGATLVATMSKLRDVVPSIRHHHENWDGTGYPDGLAGELIPIASRIIRFADTIDAMTTERPYRRPLSEAQVRAEVVRCRGTQFDPQIADRLLSSALWASLFSSPEIAAAAPVRPRFSVVGSTPRSASGDLGGRVIKGA
jgi:HD-GYP domain-containing protein (c-di-GMP phosphodiesterase class II)